MSHLIQTGTPIIPVLDERLNCFPSAPRDHKVKVEQYNDLLEDIYEREVELSRIKSSLIAMRREITEDARHLESTGVLPPDSTASLESRVSFESDIDSDDAENVLSDSSGSTGSGGAIGKVRAGSKPASKGGKKTKSKFGRLGGKHSKVPEAQLAAEWDEKLDLGRGSATRGVREDDDDLRV